MPDIRRPVSGSVLVLNQTYEPLCVVSVRRATILVLSAKAVCVAEAFAPDDSTCEDAVAALAAELALPVTTSSSLTGLYGLELRTVTAALNWRPRDWLRLTAEVLRIASVRTQRADTGLLPAAKVTQVQLGIRLIY